MHPTLIGALARQQHRELLQRAEFRDTAEARTRGFSLRNLMRRVRWAFGSALVDVGVHLMTAT